MRYLIPQYIYNHGSLPNGFDSAVADSKWGTSYGFTPILSYIVSACFMKIASLFSTDFKVLLHAARMANLLWFAGTVYFAIKISKVLFQGIYRWMFLVLSCCLPQLIFLSSYVNCDSLAIFSTVVIIYAWLTGGKNNWDIGSRVTLAIGVSACLMSYYNAYGFVLASMIYYVATSEMFSKDKNVRRREWGKFFFVVFIIFLLCGWWFIRNGILYHGDFFGLSSSNYSGELHAINGYKPSQRWDAYKAGVSVFSMLFVHFWVFQTYCSFIGVFGYMAYWLPVYYYLIYAAIYLIGFIGLILGIKKSKKNKQLPSGKEKWFHISMIGAMIIPIVISIIFSYFDDFQAQGRYCMPMLIPLMYYLTWGIRYVIERSVHSKRKQYQYAAILIIVLIVTLIGAIAQIGYPMCFAKIS
ncbi:MAG: DUF2142 domain-containing protein [Anaerofustis sp.]